MVSPPVLDRMAVRSGLPPGSVGGIRPHNHIGAGRPVGAGKRATGRRHQSLQPAPTASRCRPGRRHRSSTSTPGRRPPTRQRLADTAVPALRAICAAWRRIRGFRKESSSPFDRSVTRAGARWTAQRSRGDGLLAFFVGFGLCFGVLLFFLWLARIGMPANVPRPADPPESPEGDDDWPHTTRLLPWLLAGFVTILWLVPFNTIELDASLRSTSRLTGLLPFVAVAWIIAFAAGAEPRRVSASPGYTRPSACSWPARSLVWFSTPATSARRSSSISPSRSFRCSSPSFRSSLSPPAHFGAPRSRRF